MRVIGCGSREWTDGAIVHATLFGLTALAGDDPDVTMIEGQCPYGGADSFVAEWAKDFATEHVPMPAEIVNGRILGPACNARMLKKLLEGPSSERRFVIAFKDGFQRDIPDDRTVHGWFPERKARGGTEDLCRRAKAAGIPVYLVSHV